MSGFPPSDDPDGEPVSFPIGTLAHYGPDDQTTTKIAAAVFPAANAKPILRRWVGRDILSSRKIAEQIESFFREHGIKSVVVSEGNMGCAHEEGEDFPRGEDCPFCPFWAGKQGSARRE
jgi:hypothetical protein